MGKMEHEKGQIGVKTRRDSFIITYLLRLGSRVRRALATRKKAMIAVIVRKSLHMGVGEPREGEGEARSLGAGNVSSDPM